MTTHDFGPLVLGGNSFGWTSSAEDTFAVLDAFVEAGGTVIDTADLYSAWVPDNTGGDSEKLIGAWLARRGRRDDVRIITKVGMWDGRPGLSRDNIRAAVADSLERLQTDYVDVYLAHQDDEHTDQAEYVAAFAELVDEGRVRAVGASNFSPDRLRSAVQIARDTSVVGFTVTQDLFNLVDRDYATTLAPTVAELGLAQIPYSSLASGFLTGKYRPGREVESARAHGALSRLEDPANVQLLTTLDEIAAAHGVSVTAVSLAWLRQQPTVAAPIAGARTVEQLRALVESIDLVLTEDELTRLG